MVSHVLIKLITSPHNVTHTSNINDVDNIYCTKVCNKYNIIENNTPIDKVQYNINYFKDKLHNDSFHIIIHNDTKHSSLSKAKQSKTMRKIHSV